MRRYSRSSENFTVALIFAPLVRVSQKAPTGRHLQHDLPNVRGTGGCSDPLALFSALAAFSSIAWGHENAPFAV